MGHYLSSPSQFGTAFWLLYETSLLLSSTVCFPSLHSPSKMPFAALRLTFTPLLPRAGLLAGDRQQGRLPGWEWSCPCRMGGGKAWAWHLAPRSRGCKPLGGCHLLFLVAIKACGSGCLSGRTGCKHEKTGRGMTALETPKEEEDGGMSVLFQAWVTLPCHTWCL